MKRVSETHEISDCEMYEYNYIYKQHLIKSSFSTRGTLSKLERMFSILALYKYNCQPFHCIFTYNRDSLRAA